MIRHVQALIIYAGYIVPDKINLDLSHRGSILVWQNNRGLLRAISVTGK